MTANNSADRIRVVVVSDVRLYRDGLVACLARHDRVEAWASTAVDMVAEMRRLEPQIVLLDLSMTGSVVAVRKVLEAAPATKVVGFAVAEDESDVIAHAEAGVSGYVTRDGSVHDLCRTIERVANGEFICSPYVATQAFARLASLAAHATSGSAPATALTAREREIVALIDAGFSNKQIARQLYITLPTVKNHVHHILGKLRVQRRGEAAAKIRTSQVQPYHRPSPSLAAPRHPG